MSTDTTIIIVTYNSGHIIKKALDNLPAGYPTIIIDNASQDDTCDKIKSHSRSRVILIRNKENLGYGTANNIGMQKCTTRYVLILNPDAEINATSIEALKAALQSHKQAVMAGPSIDEGKVRFFRKGSRLQPHPLFHKKHPLFSPSMSNLMWWRRNILQDRPYRFIKDSSKTYECGFLSGACFLYDLQKMPEPFYFDEDIFLYYEESELQSRIIKHGYKLLFVPQAKAKHIGLDSSRYESSTEKIRVHYYHTGRSRGVLAAKYPDRINKSDMRAFISRTSVLAKVTRALGMRDKATKYAARLQGVTDGLNYQSGDQT